MVVILALLFSLGPGETGVHGEEDRASQLLVAGKEKE